MWRVNDLARRNAHLYNKKLALIDARQRLSWGETYRRVRRLARGLRKLGVKPGDRIALMSRNRVEVPVVFMATIELGAVLVPVNFYFKEEELKFAVGDSQSRVLIFGPEFTDIVDGARVGLASVEHFVAINDSGPDWSVSLASLQMPDDGIPPFAGEPEYPVVVLYTSGTTARPKGSVHSNRSALMWAYGELTHTGMRHDDVAICVMPVFNTIIEFLITFSCVGATMVFLPSFEADSYLRTVTDERATFLELVPTMLFKLLEETDIERHELSSLRRLLYTGAPMPEDLLRRSIRAFPAVDFYQWYGTNEVGILSQVNPADHQRGILTSAGKPLFNVDIRLLDDDGRDAEEGEIVCRSPSTMVGYHNRPDLTAAAFQEGWYLTGDIGHFDSEGYLYVSGRKKDVIVSGGQNVSTREIEELLYTHPSIGEATIVALPDRKWGEAVTAVVTVKHGLSISEDEVRAFCRSHLADYKVPKRVLVLDRLPRNEVGKVQKNELVALALAMSNDPS